MRLALIVLVVLLDQVTKVAFRENALLNTGVGFGIGNGSQGQVFGIVVFGLLAALGLHWSTRSTQGSIGYWMWPLIVGGLTSNLFDRIRLGAVVDPFALPILEIYCNVADIAIVIGFAGLFVSLVRSELRNRT